MRFTRPPLAVPLYQRLSGKTSMLEPSSKPLHFTYTIIDDGTESSWLREVQSVQGPVFRAGNH